MDSVQMTSVLLLLMSGTIAAALSSYGQRCRPAPGAVSFIVLMAVVAFWSFTYALEIASEDLASKVLWAKIEYLAITTIPVAWVHFCLRFSETKIRLKYDALPMFMVPQIVILVIIFTNEWHHLHWTRAYLDPSGGFMIVEPGVSYWFFSIYSYLLIIMGTWLLVRRYFKTRAIYRDQLIALIIGVLAPWVANALYIIRLLPIKQLDPTPFAFTITGAVFAWGFFYSRLMDLVPVARETVIERMEDLIIVTDSKGRVVEMNPATLRLLGAKPKDVIGTPMENVLSGWPDLLEKLVSLHPMAQDGKTGPKGTDDVYTIMYLSEGKKHHYDLKTTMLQDGYGRYRGRLVVLRNVTRRVEAEKKLRTSRDDLEELVKQRTLDLNQERDLLNHIMDTNPVGIVKVDREGNIVFANAQAENVLGLTKDNITKFRYNSPEWQITTIDGRPFPDEDLPFNIVKRTSKPVYDIRHAIQWPDGRSVILSINASPIIGETGKVQGMVSTVQDITHIVEHENARKESEKNYRSIFDTVKDALLVIDPTDGSVIDLNMATCDMTGYPKSELLGQSLKKLFLAEHPYTFKEATWFTKKAFKDGTAVMEWKINRRNGGTLWIDVGLTRTSIGGKDMVLAVARDVSERKETEKRKNELLITKARAEVMGFLMSALPVFAASIPLEARAVLIKSFGERFEKTLKARFDSEIEGIGHDKMVATPYGKNVPMVFDIYIAWLAALFSSFGTRARGRALADQGNLELQSCPWIEAAKGNPIFCLICRTMVMRSFTWTGFVGASSQGASIAGGGNICRFDFSLQPVLHAQGDLLPEMLQ